eukprot:jgi/Tetstr1/457343/TSEL_043946.t1
MEMDTGAGVVALALTATATEVQPQVHDVEMTISGLNVGEELHELAEGLAGAEQTPKAEEADILCLAKAAKEVRREATRRATRRATEEA